MNQPNLKQITEQARAIDRDMLAADPHDRVKIIVNALAEADAEHELDRLRFKLGTADLDRHNAEVEADRLRAELDVLGKSHASIAHQLADAGRENGLLRVEKEKLENVVNAAAAFLAGQGDEAEYDRTAALLRQALNRLKG